MNGTETTLPMETDVVCKMKVNREEAKFTSEYGGKTYYFCSLSCKKKFDEDPEKYISFYQPVR